MVEIASIRPGGSTTPAQLGLRTTVSLWFFTALLGQWTFVYYMAANYGGDVLKGDIADWSNTSIHGFVAGDLVGNLLFATHILWGIVLTFGGALQLIPQVRARAIGFHRWNGRIFIVTAVALGLGGLYLVWVRQSYLNIPGAIGVSLDGCLIVLFSIIAWTLARGGNIAAHRRWALRTFIVANGVWFFRVGLLAYITIVPGAPGTTQMLDGPFDKIWAFAHYLLPLATLEVYLRAKESAVPAFQWTAAVVIAVLTVVMGIGIVAVYNVMWAPRI